MVGVLKRLGAEALVALPKRPSDGADVAGVLVVAVPKLSVGAVGVAAAVERLPNNDGFSAAGVEAALFAVPGREVGILKSELGAAAVAEFEPGVAEVEVEPRLS